MKLNTFTNITKALSDNGRVRALLSLKQGELCVCQIIALMGLAPSTVSKHMAILKQAGLVESRKQGRWIYFRLANKQTEIFKILALLVELLKNDETAVQDKKTVKKIICHDTEELCKIQRKN